MDIRYEIIHDPEKLECITDLEIEIWMREPRNVVPAMVMTPIVANGGLAILAYMGEQVIGASFAFPAYREEKVSLWSHTTAVRELYRSQGIGFQLKQYQRRWALEFGYDTIRWTFDPLRGPNAKFNFCYLGAVSNRYHHNYYGTIKDGLNAGLPTDRLEVTWNLRDERVERLAQSKSNPSGQALLLREAGVLLGRSTSGTPNVMLPEQLTAPYYLIELPAQIMRQGQLEPNHLRVWQAALQAVFQHAFAQHYQAVDYVITQESGWYVLQCQPV
jgi:chorismate synthase